MAIPSRLSAGSGGTGTGGILCGTVDAPVEVFIEAGAATAGNCPVIIGGRNCHKSV